MCAQIIDLNELVGDDIVFSYGRPPVEYAVPGDIDTETVFALFDTYRGMVAMEGDDPEKLADDVKRRFEELTGRVLTLLQVRSPSLEHYPFGIKATGIVLQRILAELGMTVTPENPTPPPRKTVPKKRPPARKR